MAKPIMQSHGLELYHAELEDVYALKRNLSKENLREIVELYEDTPEELLPRLLEGDMAHAVKFDGEVMALCGVDQGVMWTMFSKGIRKHWRSFVKASPELVDFYHHFYPSLYCNVWSENTFIHNWLVHLGFLPEIIFEDDNGNLTVHFVRCIFDADSVDSATSRPVMH